MGVEWMMKDNEEVLLTRLYEPTYNTDQVQPKQIPDIVLRNHLDAGITAQLMEKYQTAAPDNCYPSSEYFCIILATFVMTVGGALHDNLRILLRQMSQNVRCLGVHSKIASRLLTDRYQVATDINGHSVTMDSVSLAKSNFSRHWITTRAARHVH